MLTVYKASAGSGKTFQLVAEYLKLLLKKPASYRNILAVTFTNKATQEMKSRILEQLNMLAVNKKSDYLQVLTGDLSLDEEVIRKRSKEILKNILHDYSRFSVSTIDSFTQKVIRAFNREMGISPNFELELDSKLILEEAVDRLLVKIDTDAKLRKWLVKFSEEKIRDNKSQRIEEDIKELGKELFKENFQMFFPDGKDEENPYSRENLEAFFKELEQIINSFEQTLRKKAAECLKIIENAGFTEDDFSYKKGGVAGYFIKLSSGDFSEPGKRATDAADSAERWFSAKHKHAVQLQQLVENELQPRLKSIISFFEAGSVNYLSATEVKKQLRMLGILTDLKEEISLLLIEKEILQISDSNLLLNKIIGKSETPFIYEKIGNRYNYFMLDEFQDTSSLQWANFKPLIANAMAEGNPTLLVGDVKQSIYRWRNSDWNILATQINNDFPHFPPLEIPLEKNWRSHLNIIDFNNSVFGVLINSFENLLAEEIKEESPRDKFSSVYSHYIQKPGKPDDKKTGLAEIVFLPEEDFGENSVSLLVEQVKRLQDNGLKASEIAVLLRKNSEGAKVVKAFLEASEKPENKGYNLSVLSGESLFLYASQAVNFVILVIELLIESKNEIQKAALLHILQTWLNPALRNKGFDIPDLSEGSPLSGNDFELLFESELGERINILKEKVLLFSLDETITEICSLFRLFEIETELPFLLTLIDKAAEYKLSFSNDLSNFLNWWKEIGFETSVSVNDELDAVRLLTVHKAKGLEFEAVLLPFFDWNLSWKGFQTPTLWCNPSEEPFSRFPLLPVKATQKLTGTIFKENYIQEKTSSYVDTLNLVYVAFTRAKSVLLINTLRKEKSENFPKTVNSVLDAALQILSDEMQFSNCWNYDHNVFSYGEIPSFDKLKPAVSPVLIENFAFFEFGKRIRLQSNSDNFLELSEQSRSVKNFGKLMHEILARIKNADDIEPACTAAFKEGIISITEKDEILEKLKSSLDNPLVAQWFNGEFAVLNERNLLSPESMYRPDRIMISGEKAVVVDYKWGERNPEKYHRQVNNYSRLLKAAGYKNVEGYLWYLNQDEVERVI